MEKFTKKETQTLNPFFTNIDKPVFILLNMPEVLKGALFSRYSRSPKTLRRLFLDEYINSGELNISSEAKSLKQAAEVKKSLNTERAKRFYQKWLAMFGDDSIAELGGIHIGIENISVVATKAIEDRRIGISPLEKSTRYVHFNDKVSGEYRYYKDQDILNSKDGYLYKETMDFLFDTYSSLIDPMKEYFRAKFPKPKGISDPAYNTSIRAKVYDTIRGLLPMGTLTNMGIFANGRAIEYLITKMYAHPLTEVKHLAKSIHEECDLIIENFVERVRSDKGMVYINYLRETESEIERMEKEFNNCALEKPNKKSVVLLEWEKNASQKAAASILFPKSQLSYQAILKRINNLTKEDVEKIIKGFVRKRQGRWHKVGKAFEEIYYSFEIISDLGAYKDLQRHRMCSQFRQKFTTEYGYETPKDIIDAGFRKDYEKAMNMANKTYKKFKGKFPYQVQYLACHGNLGRWRIKMNLREAFHLCELRSSPQGHPNYRQVAQEIYKLIRKVHPILGNAMKYVNMQDPGLERLASEVRKEEKLAAIKMKKNSR